MRVESLAFSGAGWQPGWQPARYPEGAPFTAAAPCKRGSLADCQSTAAYQAAPQRGLHFDVARRTTPDSAPELVLLGLALTVQTGVFKNMSATALGGGATVPLKGPTEPRLRSRIAPLDGIRGIASLMVFFFHVPHLAATPGSLLSRWQLLSSVGWSGVDLFFVLSGFLITGILLDNCNSERYFGTFYRRRIHRIFPLYYLLLAIYAVCLAARVHLFDLFSSAPPVWWYFAGLQNFAMAAAGTYGGVWLAGTWSLAIEEQFYLLLPAAVYYIRSPKTLARIALALIVVAPLLRLLVEAVWPQNAFMETYLLLPTRIDTISVGVLLACAYRSESAWKWATRLFPWVLVVFGALVLRMIYLRVNGSALSYTFYALFYGSVVVSALYNPVSAWAHFLSLPVMRYLGKISYCTYLVHHIALRLAFQWVGGSRSSVKLALVSLVVAAAATLAISAASFHFLEGPLIRRGHRYSY